MSSLHLTLGVAGTAKNTGKTTATILLLNHFNLLGTKIGLTSIGYDGESVDNVTGLPKPRLFVQKGLLIVTAERCLEVSSAKLRVIEKLPIQSPLGKLVCAVVEKEGLAVIAGPNQSRHVQAVRTLLYQKGAELIIVDGALNRMAPMVETDGFIMATGASYKTDINEIAKDAHYLTEICNCPTVSNEFIQKGLHAQEPTVVWDDNGKILASSSKSLLTVEDLIYLDKFIQKAAGFYSRSLITSSCLSWLSDLRFAPGMQIVLQDTAKILTGNKPHLVHDFFHKLQDAGGAVFYRNPLPLLAITVNPFYPRYRYETNDYEAAYVERSELKNCVAAAVDIPVFDVVRDDCKQLVEILLSKFTRLDSTAEEKQ